MNALLASVPVLAASSGVVPALLAGLAVIACAGFAAMLGLGLWNLYFERFVADVKEQQKESFLSALRRVVLIRISGFNERHFSPAYLARIDKMLTTAGNPGELLPVEVVGLQEVSFAAFTLFGLFLMATVGLYPFWVAAFMALGWYYPWIWLRDKKTKRQHHITRALPYNLDLLTLSVEAGLDFAQAIGKVVDKGRQGALADELRLVLRNLKLGKTREEALRLMGERCDIASLTSFVNALIQADRMGTSLGKILRIQSTQMRIDRTNRAEKLANEAPVKMLFPLIACIFPTVFMILFGPIIFQVITGGD